LLASGSAAGATVEAATWRLTLRLAGFTLDRHRGLAAAFTRAALFAGTGQASSFAAVLTPPSGALPADGRIEADDDDDEWAFADLAAQRLVEAHLAAVVATQPKCLSAAVPVAPPLLSTVLSADVSNAFSSLQTTMVVTAGGDGLSMLD